MYLPAVSGHERPTEYPLPQPRYIISEQVVVMNTIKPAICDIVRVFGQYLDMSGLEGLAADVCQNVWDTECGGI